MKTKMRVPTRLSALILFAGLAGCGQTSFFDVTLRADTTLDITMSHTCRVDVSGAATETFTLNDNKCSHVMSFNIGSFEYGTTAESGTLNFHVSLLRGDVTTLGQGDGSGVIKAGGHQVVMVQISPTP